MIPPASVIPQMLFPQTVVVALGPAGLLVGLCLTALLVFLVRGTIAELRATRLSDAPAAPQQVAPPLGRAA